MYDMVLRRIGNKSLIANKIIKYFPIHSIYIEPFFGAGGIFFNKYKSKFNIMNDIDSDVYNLYMVIKNNKEQLEKEFYIMPIHSDLLEYCKANKESDPIKKALRFLFISLFMPFGHQGTIDLNPRNSKNRFYEVINDTFDLLFNVKFSNLDFRVFIQSVVNRINSDGSNIDNAFIYADPPYLGTVDNYSHSFTEQDSIDLFNSLESTQCKFAMSEFDNPFILEQAKQRNLNIIEIGERQNLKNRRTEILITNYETEKSLFD